MIQSSERITCLAAWQSRSWDMWRGEEREMKLNAKWVTPYDISRRDDNLWIHPLYAPGPTCSWSSWKEPVVHMHISYACWLETARLSKRHIQLETTKEPRGFLSTPPRLSQHRQAQTTVSSFFSEMRKITTCLQTLRHYLTLFSKYKLNAKQKYICLKYCMILWYFCSGRHFFFTSIQRELV